MIGMAILQVIAADWLAGMSPSIRAARRPLSDAL
jgi:hypothetical protein